MPGLLHYKFLACSPETTLHYQKEQAANDKQQIIGVATDFSLRVWRRPTEERMLVKTKPRKGAPRPEVHVGSLQESYSVSGNSTSQQAQAWQFFVEILGHNSVFWRGIKVSTLFQKSKIVQSSVLKTQLLFPLQVLPKEKFFPRWSTTNVLRTKDACVSSVF